MDLAKWLTALAALITALVTIFVAFHINPFNEDTGISITYPKDGAYNIQAPFDVGGTISGDVPKDHYMWVAIQSHSYSDGWWPQWDYIIPVNGKWSHQVQIGNNVTNREIDVAVILADQSAEQEFEKWINEGRNTGSWSSGMQLPDSAKIKGQITVTCSSIRP